jgi:hypothetical protein
VDRFVSSVLRRAATAVPAAAIVLAVVLLTPYGSRGVVVHWVEVGVLVAVLLVLVGRLRRSLRSAEPSPFEQALEGSRGRPPKRVAQLAQLEREVGMGIANAFDLHNRLLPTLRETGAGLLSGRHGIDLEAQPDAARTALGNDIWEIVRPDRPAPIDRAARGADPASIDRVLTALEAL